MNRISETPEAVVASRDTSAGKSLALLDAFTVADSVVLGVSELAQLAGLPKSTAHRLLATLVTSGFVRRVQDKYMLSAKAFELGNRFGACQPNGLRDLATPFMAELYAMTRQTVHLGVLSGTDVLYVEKIFGQQVSRCPTHVGARRPAYATGLGKAILAFSDSRHVARNLAVGYQRYTRYTICTSSAMTRALTRIRTEGCATDFEESYIGVHCLAVPICHPRTKLAVAALSLTTVAGRESLLYRSQGAMLSAAEALSAELGRAA